MMPVMLATSREETIHWKAYLQGDIVDRQALEGIRVVISDVMNIISLRDVKQSAGRALGCCRWGSEKLAAFRLHGLPFSVSCQSKRTEYLHRHNMFLANSHPCFVFGGGMTLMSGEKTSLFP